ncbi:MAG TPA: hypothetical protein VGO80_15200 [Solirubrobacteraceae bacterium]|nr:hypothetical protein [Solirubrobacteraceae bacterium]
MTEKKPAHKEFKVTIDVKLPQDALDRIERAIQKAVLVELADTDVADGYSVIMRVPADKGDRQIAAAQLPPPLDGIVIRPQSSELS